MVHPNDPPFPKEEFEELAVLREGTFGDHAGIIYKARYKETNEIVVLKTILGYGDTPFLTDRGIPQAAIREIGILRQLSHPNIVILKGVLMKDEGLYLMFEFLSLDLKQYIRSFPHGEFMDPYMVKSYTYQVIQAITYCHCRGIIHRYLSPEQLFINSDGIIKVADFGLARKITLPLKVYNSEVVIIWYRAPEILLGGSECRYSTPVDMWSIGLIMAEMASHDPIIQGNSVLEQILLIFRLLGTPTEEQWPGMRTMEEYRPDMPQFPPPQNLRQSKFAKQLDDDGFDFFMKCLECNPDRRITGIRALSHPFFDALDKKGMPAANVPYVDPRPRPRPRPRVRPRAKPRAKPRTIRCNCPCTCTRISPRTRQRRRSI